ncbi:MAG: (d)CMP kinase [Deltaproteobacteria bacterium]|nr:(d)CMP kinase [Deltaproteobacteria bacterium]
MDESSKSVIIAIDGPAGAGKSTVAKAVATQLGYRLVDTGAIYRAVALSATRQGIAFKDESGLARIVSNLNITFHMTQSVNHVILDGEDISELIRTAEISQGASIVSAHPKVRTGLLELQRRLAGEGGAVLEGRDIGTVVCPNAQVKIFLDASADERARRRQQDLKQAGVTVSKDKVLAEIKERDDRDTKRATAPLIAAKDAIVLDSTKLSIAEVVQQIVLKVKSALP